MQPKRQIAIAVILLAVLDGAAMQMAPSPLAAGAFAIAIGLAISFSYFVWYRVDAQQRGFPRFWLLNFGIAGASIISFPYYLVRTRGVTRGAYESFLFLLSFLGLMFFAVLGSLLGYLVRL